MSRRANGCGRSWRSPGRGFPERRRPRLSAGARTAGRMAGAVSRQRPRCCAGARDRLQARPDRRDQPAGREGQFRLDRAGAAGAHSRRPGRGAAAGPELAGAGERAQHGHIGQLHHPGARRHLSGRRHRAGDRRAARLARDPAHRAGSAAERAHRSAQPVRDVRIRAGLSSDLAARPGSDPDRAGRCRAGSAAGDGGQRACAGGRRPWRRASRDPTASPWAARWRRARSRRPR